MKYLHLFKHRIDNYVTILMKLDLFEIKYMQFSVLDKNFHFLIFLDFN